MFFHSGQSHLLPLSEQDFTNTTARYICGNGMCEASPIIIYHFHKGGYTSELMEKKDCLFYFASGSGLIRVNGIEKFIKIGSYASILPNELYKFVNTGDNVMVVIKFTNYNPEKIREYTQICEEEKN